VRAAVSHEIQELPIIEIERASGVELRDLTLTRSKGKTGTKAEAVLAIDCRDLVLENLRVLDNRTCSGAIVLRACAGAQVRHCRVLNYMRISIDDRTASPDWGYAFMGMKAMHGSRNVLILGNQFSKNDLWSIGLMPGTASHTAAARGGGVPVEANVDGGSIIANNIISDFGYGRSHWIWGGSGHDCCPIRLDTGQKPDNPPLSDVIIQGNMVDDSGRNGVLVDGSPRVVPPRYKYAVYVAGGPGGPKGLHFSNNVFHPGTAGAANVELKP
jgi:hypothetical protein